MLIVGPGGSPNENGETMIDALVMDGVINHQHPRSYDPILHQVSQVCFFSSSGYRKDILR